MHISEVVEHCCTALRRLAINPAMQTKVAQVTARPVHVGLFSAGAVGWGNTVGARSNGSVMSLAYLVPLESNSGEVY